MRGGVGVLLLLVALAGCGGPRMDDAFDAFDGDDGTDDVALRPRPPTPSCEDPLGCLGRPAKVGVFDAQSLPEASGLAVSGREPDLLWLVDDRPGTGELWAIRADGRLVARVAVRGLDAVNVEALASGPCGRNAADPCLYVGDIGDNARARGGVRVLRVPEPDLSAGPPPPLEPDVAELRYPGPPEDAEALLVDGEGVPYLVSKATFDPATGVTGPTALYAAPGFRSGMLLRLGEIALPPPDPAVASLLYGNVVTGGEVAADRVLLRTYDHAVEFVAPAPGAALADFGSWPSRVVPSPWQPQGEAAAYGRDGCGYFMVSEGVGDVWFTPCASGTERNT